MNGTALRPPDEIIKWRFVRYKSDYRVSIRVARSGEEVVTLGRCSTLSEGSIGGILGGEFETGEVSPWSFPCPLRRSR